MKLCCALGLNTGLNTYTGLINLLEKEVENNYETTEDPEYEFIGKYVEKMAKSDEGSSFHGKIGKSNLVATLADIFMGGT